MPKRRYEQREPTHDWQQIRPLLKDPAQITYEILRLIVLWGQTPKERAAETGVPQRTIYYKANLFDQAGMASLLPPAPPPDISRQDKRSLPPPIRQEIVDLHSLAGQQAMVNIFQDLLTLEYQQEKLSRSSVEWQPDERHFTRVGNPRLYQHPYQSPQLDLWEPGTVERFVIIRTDSPMHRRKRLSRVLAVQPSLPLDSAGP
jgi:hypothetical protein